MVSQGLDLESSPCKHLVSAFMAMETSDTLIILARICGGGSITEDVQRFILDKCLEDFDGDEYVPFLKVFCKKLIMEAESINMDILDELYERCARYMVSSWDDIVLKRNRKITKYITFNNQDGSTKLVVPLRCSLNMLEGDTGCSIWPSGIFLSEFILSCPEIFSGKSCVEVGAGVGLVGICLGHVKASKVILTDGDHSTLANMKFNLEMNRLSASSDAMNKVSDGTNVAQIVHLPWESASGSELVRHMPDIILGADVIYDPQCLPHLVRIISGLLRGRSAQSQDFRPGETVAYIASVVRNIETFNYFMRLAEEADLVVLDITKKVNMLDLLPYMYSYDRSSINLFSISRKFQPHKHFNMT